MFTAIRQGKVDEVAAILDKKPELISCLAKAPPKKDDGQSPLIVAIKSDNLEVAHLLLDQGADVNFRDSPTQPGNEVSRAIQDYYCHPSAEPGGWSRVVRGLPWP